MDIPDDGGRGGGKGGDDDLHTFFDISTLDEDILIYKARRIKRSIFLLYKLGMHNRLSLFSSQSIQALLRSDNLGSPQLGFWLKNTRALKSALRLYWARATTVSLDTERDLNRNF